MPTQERNVFENFWFLLLHEIDGDDDDDDDDDVLVRHKLLGMLKELCESEIFEEFSPVDKYLFLIGACVVTASHIQTGWK